MIQQSTRSQGRGENTNEFSNWKLWGLEGWKYQEALCLHAKSCNFPGFARGLLNWIVIESEKALSHIVFLGLCRNNNYFPKHPKHCKELHVLHLYTHKQFSVPPFHQWRVRTKSILMSSLRNLPVSVSGAIRPNSVMEDEPILSHISHTSPMAWNHRLPAPFKGFQFKPKGWWIDTLLDPFGIL